MSYNESDESECQGFIPNKLIIKQRQQYQLKDYTSSLQFEPRYIIGEIVIKKQPPQSYFLNNDNSTYFHQVQVNNQTDQKQTLPNASAIYLTSDYQCVYSRFKKPFGHVSKEPFSNDIVIKTLSRLQQFRVLKNWKSEYFTARSSQKLKFDSKFESGNLLCAFKNLKQLDTYTLFMQNDTNTYGYNQWFYFSIRQSKPNKKYTFKIANFKKRYSFFEKGMQPYIFSLQQSKTKKCGWYRGGTSFKYYKSNFSQRQRDYYYTLQFQIQFLHQNDFVLISTCPPYSYSKLIQHLGKYQQQAIQNGLTFQIQSISKTLGGNQVPYLTISKQSKKNDAKRIIVITARQHSGEIWSSYLADQIIKAISQQKHPFYKWIMDHFDVHIFPMVNVDGVIYGNFRCDLGGYDLNRCWKDPSPILQPHIYKIRSKLQNLAEEFKIDFFLDLHTHSKDHGFFAYCCVQSYEGRKFSQIISNLSPLFRYSACTFGIQQYKSTTIRSQIFNLTRNINTVTIELSAFGYKHPQSNIIQPFTTCNIKAIGQSLISAIYYYQTNQIPYIKIESFIKETVLIKGNYYLQYNNDHAVQGSDSDPQGDQIDQSIKIKKIFKQIKISSDIKIKRKIHKLKKDKYKQKNNINLSTTSQFNQTDSLQFSPTNRYRALTETKQKKDIIQSSIRESKEMSKTNFEGRRIANSFNKMLKLTKLNAPNQIHQSIPDSAIRLEHIKKSKPLNLIQFSLKKLPIFPIQKLSNHFNFQNPNTSLTVNKKILQQEHLIKNNVATFYRSKKQPKQQSKNNSPNNQFLCVMSQSKKKQQIQKIKERRQKQNQSQLVSKLKLNAIRQSTVLQRYMKQKKSDKVDNIAKIWLNNFNRYSKSLEDQDY